jgi:uncharacterized protein YqgC (DUF456 family)
MFGEETIGLVLTVTVMLIGLLGTLIPGIPGAPLILIAAVGHKFYFGEASVSYPVLALLVLLTVASLVFDFLGSLVGAKKLGATWRGMTGAIVGAIVGLFFGLPGLILGPIIGAFLFELLGGREWRDSAKAGFGALVGMLLGTLGRIVCSVVMIAVFCVSLFWDTRPAAEPPPQAGESAAAILPGRPGLQRL